MTKPKPTYTVETPEDLQERIRALELALTAAKQQLEAAHKTITDLEWRIRDLED